MDNWITQLLEQLLPHEQVSTFYAPSMLTAIAIMAIVAYWFCHRVICVVVRIVTSHTQNDWDDDLLNDHVLKAASQLAPALLVAHFLPTAFNSESSIQIWLTKVTDLYILWALVHLINSFLQAIFDALDKRGKYRIHTMKGVLQILKLFFIIISIIIGISILIGKSPITILTALGASAAILMLVFQDTILGLVAGIQLTVNDMLKKGDWIVVPKSNANGEVIEVSLTTVKIRNWDNSVTTIPPYTLIRDSFQNYEPMIQSGARRVSRYIYIDINTVHFASKTELDNLLEEGLITPSDIEHEQNPVNIQLFSIHLERFLKNHKEIRSDLLYMVRQLQPTPQGIPLELYFFTSQTEWKKYEHIQSQIFDYIYACVQSFGLRIYQAPAGADLKQINDESVLSINKYTPC